MEVSINCVCGVLFVYGCVHVRVANNCLTQRSREHNNSQSGLTFYTFGAEHSKVSPLF